VGRVREELAEQVPDEVGRRLVSGREQRIARGEQLVATEPRAVLLGGGEDADQVLARVLPAILDQRRHVREELGQALLRGQGAGEGRAAGTLESEDVR
jgi:hypothetical protein